MDSENNGIMQKNIRSYRNLLKGKMYSEEGETLTEVLVSILIISLGIILFLSVFLASGKILRQGEVQMSSYYDSRNKLEAGESDCKLTDNYVLELTDAGNGTASGVYKSLASDAYKAGKSTNYNTGQYPITLYVNSKKSHSSGSSEDLEDSETGAAAQTVYRYEAGKK